MISLEEIHTEFLEEISLLLRKLKWLACTGGMIMIDWFGCELVWNKMWGMHLFYTDGAICMKMFVVYALTHGLDSENFLCTKNGLV